MHKQIMSLAVFCLVSSGISANAQTTTQVTTNATPTSPTEVGTTTMPPGNYLVIDQNTGNKYSLEVTTKGTMIFGPAPASATAATSATTAPATAASKTSALSSKAASGVKGMAENQVEKYIENKGVSEIQNFIK